MDAEYLMVQSLRVGSCCIIESSWFGSPKGERASKVQILDLETSKYREEDARFLVGGRGNNAVNFLKTCSNRYVIQKEDYTNILVYDTLTGEKTSRAFPEEVTLYLQNDGDTFLETATLPLAPLTALSPAPWSAVSTAHPDERRCPTAIRLRYWADAGASSTPSRHASHVTVCPSGTGVREASAIDSGWQVSVAGIWAGYTAPRYSVSSQHCNARGEAAKEASHTDEHAERQPTGFPLSRVVKRD